MGSSAFARHYLRNHCYFLFLRVLRCFSSPGSPPAMSRVPESLPAGCPIRRSADQRAFAPPRGLSQLITSFFASESQGIPHAPFLHSVITDKSRNLAWYLFSPSTSFVENTGPFSPLLFSSLKSSLLFLFAIYVVSRISLSSPCPRLRFQSCQCPLLGWRSRGSSLSSPLCLRSPWQS